MTDGKPATVEPRTHKITIEMTDYQFGALLAALDTEISDAERSNRGETPWCTALVEVREKIEDGHIDGLKATAKV
jgi:hypothetical protein